MSDFGLLFYFYMGISYLNSNEKKVHLLFKLWIKFLIQMILCEGVLMSEHLIGQEVEAYCGKCKIDTLHVITSLKNEVTDKVMCKMCMSYHKYRKPAGAASKEKKKTVTKSEKVSGVKTVKRPRRDKWTRLLSETDFDGAMDYSMDKEYDLATAINHKKFGVGIVKNIITMQKIEVLFHDGAKILVQNYLPQ